jgi:myo-inositol catabolism protein IolC
MNAMATKKTRGYTKQLLILPFDHRGSFQSKMFGIHGVPTPKETELISSFKTIIYEGFEKAVQAGLPKEWMGVLVDEQFGKEVLQRAKAKGFTTSLCVEKSGQDEFDFEYGKDYGAHIEKFDPELVKVLVRYNPEADKTLNDRQANKLAELSQYLDRSGRKFMFELLVPHTEAQLKQCNGDKKIYDLEMRPSLMVKAIQELYSKGIEPDVWKLEGLDREADYKKVVAATHAGGRNSVGTIVLGRGENDAKVREWLKAGAKVPGVIGFAVGRTVFWEPLKDHKEGKITREQASDKIADTYGSFCRLWLDLRAEK